MYLALYCRRLRPDVQIVSRATFEKNVDTLHRAGTDFVLSLATLGAAEIFNTLEGAETVPLTEGLNLFEVPVSPRLQGRSLSECALRQETGCTLVALRTEAGLLVNPNPAEPLPAGADAILIGSREAEARYLEEYGRPGG